MAVLVGETSNSLSTLPPFQALTNQPATEKATIALQFLREVAIAQRQSQRQKFYSIRAVAKHFSLPTSRVTRLYSQLKTEGILSSIWGSKTIIEPTQLDNDIRLKGIVALPMPLHAFSVTSSYKLFARS